MDDKNNLTSGATEATAPASRAHHAGGGGVSGRLDLVREEAARVRAELGYPIMVTPLSQFVGTQAAINVITGARYKQVTDEIIQYALGLWGREALEHMDANIRDLILNRPRAREIATMKIQPALLGRSQRWRCRWRLEQRGADPPRIC